MNSHDQEAELALARLVEQARAWSREDPHIEAAGVPESPIEALLHWWGDLRFPDPDDPRIPPQGQANTGGTWTRAELKGS